LKWGSKGSGNGQFETPDGICVDSNDNLYTVDDYNMNVQKFDSSGNYLTQWGSSGSGHGQFCSLSCGIQVTINGIVVIADAACNRIQEYSTTGTYIDEFGRLGLGALDNADFLAIAPSGNIYIIDGIKVIKVFGP